MSRSNEDLDQNQISLYEKVARKISFKKEKPHRKIVRVADCGPLSIANYYEFLESSRADFLKHWMSPSKQREEFSNFVQVAGLASGAFGAVVLVRHKVTWSYYAMKAQEKVRIVQTKNLEHCRYEKNVLQSVNFPFTIYLKYFFVDNVYVYFVMPFIPGGELFRLHKLSDRLSEADAKFYASQVILAIEYLHHLDLVYRDLKLENVMIDRDGFVKVIDFGLTKPVKGRTYTFCGTLDYLAPEVILSKGYGKAADWWAVGIFLFELVAGKLPFRGQDDAQLVEKILALKYRTPFRFSRDLKNLTKNILQENLSRRFGNLKNGVNDIKEHHWFRELNWMAVLNRKVTPPFIPKLDVEGSTQYFEGPGHPHYLGGFEPLRKSRLMEYADEFADF